MTGLLSSLCEGGSYMPVILCACVVTIWYLPTGWTLAPNKRDVLGLFRCCFCERNMFIAVPIMYRISYLFLCSLKATTNTDILEDHSPLFFIVGTCFMSSALRWQRERLAHHHQHDYRKQVNNNSNSFRPLGRDSCSVVTGICRQN